MSEMASAIPRIRSKVDWIARTAAARAELVKSHGFRDDDFMSVDRFNGDDPVLYMSSIYPRQWGEMCRYGGNGELLSGFVKDRSIPNGLTLYWPQGTDYWGEGYDARDPIFLLSDCLFWSSLTEADIAEMLADTRAGA